MCVKHYLLYFPRDTHFDQPNRNKASLVSCPATSQNWIKLMPLILSHSVTQTRLTFHLAKPADLNARTRRGGTELSPPPGSQHYVQILQTRPPKQPQFCEAKRLVPGGLMLVRRRRVALIGPIIAPTQSRSHRQSCKNLDQASQPHAHFQFGPLKVSHSAVLFQGVGT